MRTKPIHPETIMAFIYPRQYEYFAYCRIINVVDYQISLGVLYNRYVQNDLSKVSQLPHS